MRIIIFSLVIAILTGCTSLTESGRETARFNKFLDETFNEYLSHSPESLTYLGQKKRYGELNDYSEAFEQKMLALDKKKLAALKGFNYELLDEQAKLSYDLFKKKLEEGIEDFKWKDYHYTVNHQYGPHTGLPVFMMNMHRVDSEQDLKDYISRLNEFRRVMTQVGEQIKRSEKQGVVPPKFVFPLVMDATKKMIKGQPFDTSKNDSPLFADFKNKLNNLKLSKEKADSYMKQGREAFLTSVKPAYTGLLATLKTQSRRANSRDGVWKFPKGKEYYKVRVNRYTTTDMTPEQIHQLGLKEVARLRAEMTSVMKKLGYKGDLKSFFKKVRTDKDLYYPNNDQGAKAYIESARKYYERINKKVPEYFHRRPKAGFEIKAVEEFRENSAGIAFYEGPAEDGSRPGVYYVNTKDMNNLPKYETEAILYHEGAPGHHFQIALAQELENLPKLRRYVRFTAYTEGWGLYTERLAKDMGAYKDLYSEFGRLGAEILRAARLVVDTGIHVKKWSRAKATRYLDDNLPSSHNENKNQIERYIVMPGQATAYMVGMLKIYELREMAKKQLKEKFDIRDFHDVVLSNGPVPLDVLENLVTKYVEKNKKS